jgi:uncharacterized delta-60 repeat protein
VARYLPDGSLDPSFGQDGTVTTDLGTTEESPSVANDVAIQGNGKIVLAGWTRAENCCATSDFALVRYNTDGTLDGSFDSDGIVIRTSSPAQDQATAVTLTWNGKIVVAGTFDDQFEVARFRRDGSRDTTFGNHGSAFADFGALSGAADVAIQGNGKIVVAGGALPDGGGDYDVAVARFQPDGTLDGQFGTGGMVTTDFAGHDDVGHAVALEGDAKIVVGGDAQLGSGHASRDFALARYL